jgi:archaellum component FlaC
MSATATVTVKDLRRDIDNARDQAEDAAREVERVEERIERIGVNEDGADSLQTLSEAVADHRRGILSTQELYDVLDGLS